MHAVYCEVMNSAALRYLLRTVLAVGNFLNYHRRPQGRAGCPGFSVESVLKARDVKSTDGRSLLHVIAFALARDAPHHLRALAEMAPKLQAAAACEYSVTRSQVIDFAPLWLAYHNSGAAGAPPLPPQTPPPPPRPHMSGSSGRGRGTGGMGSGEVSPSSTGGGGIGEQHHPGAAEASSSPSSHAASALSGLSGGGDVMLVSAKLSWCLLSLSLSLSLSRSLFRCLSFFLSFSLSLSLSLSLCLSLLYLFSLALFSSPSSVPLVISHSSIPTPPSLWCARSVPRPHACNTHRSCRKSW